MHYESVYFNIQNHTEKRCAHRDFLEHYKRLTKIFVSLFHFALQNTRLNLLSIVCYTIEILPTKINNSINWNLLF